MTDRKGLAQQLAEMLPCPFCGGKATVDNNGSDVWWVECCNDCEIRPESRGFRSPFEAIEAWNRRV